MEMDRKRKEEACMHAPPKFDKCCHLSQCAHTHLCHSQFQPIQRDLTGCIYIVSQDIFCAYPCLLQHKKETEFWACRQEYRNVVEYNQQRHSAIFQIAIDSVNQSRETFQPLWQALSKPSLFLETRFSCSL